MDSSLAAAFGYECGRIRSQRCVCLCLISWYTLLGCVFYVAHVTVYSVEDPNNLLCGCTKTAFKFSSEWLAKVIEDTGDHYLFPVPCSGWVDPDGHCHEAENALHASNVKKATPKLQVRGVFP